MPLSPVTGVRDHFISWRLQMSQQFSRSDHTPGSTEGSTLVPMLVWGLALCIVGIAVIVAFV